MKTVLRTDHVLDDHHTVIVFAKDRLFKAYLSYRDDDGSDGAMLHMFSMPQKAFKMRDDFCSYAIEKAPEYFGLLKTNMEEE